MTKELPKLQRSPMEMGGNGTGQTEMSGIIKDLSRYDELPEHGIRPPGLHWRLELRLLTERVR
ncbi:MAG: hypothetical protein AB7G80_08105 [Dongiaceae bacterium]